jgi:hypothetical protein
MHYTHTYKPKKEDLKELDIKEDININKELNSEL